MEGARERVLAAPPADGLRFDPVLLVRAVNALAGSETRDALAVLKDCASALAARGGEPAPPASGVVLLALALFVPDAPGAPLPAPSFGAPDVPLPPPSPELPRLPLVLEAQLPFLLAGGYEIGGAFDIAGLDRCVAAAHPRAAPLAPERSPASAADALTTGPLWARLVPPEHRARVEAMVRGQALRAAGDLRWDPERERFVPAAG